MVATGAESSPMAQAIDEFLDEMKIRDQNNPFYQEVLLSRSVLALEKSSNGVQICADELGEFVKTLEAQKRSSRSIKTLGSLKPFIHGLSGLLETCQGLLNASPFSVGVAFVGAKLVLSLAQKANSIFDEIFGAMIEIGNCLKCYAKISMAYETSDEVRECLVASYKNIVTFWATATKILSQNERLREGIFNWISAGEDLDVRGDLQIHADRRHRNTCTWIFQEKDFQKWSDPNSPTHHLWYKAPPGSGKSVLSSAVIKHFEEKGLPTAYFFYSFNDSTKRNALAGLRSLAVQLLNILKSDIPDRVIEIYREEMARHAKKMRLPSLIMEVLHELLKQSPIVYLIVDGLDECMDDLKACELISTISSVPVYGTTKWFFTSREDGQIKSTMNQINALTISPLVSTIRADIHSFIADELETVTLNVDIDDFVNHSEGSFLYSQYLVDTLRGEGITCDADFTRALEGFPRGLTGYYLRTLVKLCERSEWQQDLVRRIFILLSSAFQSITWDELCNALAIRRGASDHSKTHEPYEKQIQDLCGSLLLFDRSTKGNENNPKVKFCHKTVTDFLMQSPHVLLADRSFSRYKEMLPHIQKFFVEPATASTQIGLDCLTLLQYKRYEENVNMESILEENSPKDAFLKYAAAFWFLHLDIGQHDEEPSKALWYLMSMEDMQNWDRVLTKCAFAERPCTKTVLGYLYPTGWMSLPHLLDN
ncbi:hypothetical protein N7456_003661 [Penicillium angulare]|uniref:Nephrocystin 3-like N-terminal domain-containing protein n=1 Tax=Penicillium angulare TaxID=116970 RepID=A0A9W9FV39_9EURO|nr:hypothetical protein N7456_003661 [Penicillium angulare]